MSRGRVLIAEDDVALVKVLESLLKGADFTVTTAADGQAALERFRAEEGGFDLVLSDINMPRMDGLELIDQLKVHDPHVVVVFLTAYSSVDNAVAALRKGAFDYVTKPFRNDRLVQIVGNAIAQRRLFAENRTLRRELEQAFGFQQIVGRSPGMGSVLRVVEKAAPSQSSILIRGETGTGKEVVARAIHHASPRAGRPFVAINCAALPEALLESELFGHEKGAFTGAVKSNQGLFRAAHGGTLFLDEVGEMSPAVQAKLLRVLETREVRPVGSTEAVAVDVRILAATHRDLLSEQVEFREDLFYRLAVIEVEVPALRERQEDIAPLARHFLQRLARERGEPERTLVPDTLDLIQGYAWPGNVRELLNALEHATTLGDEVLTPADLPPRVRCAAPAAPVSATPAGGAVQTLSAMERAHVERVLAQTSGDRKEAAALLGIDLSTLYRKLKRWQQG